MSSFYIIHLTFSRKVTKTKLVFSLLTKTLVYYTDALFVYLIYAYSFVLTYLEITNKTTKI